GRFGRPPCNTCRARQRRYEGRGIWRLQMLDSRSKWIVLAAACVAPAAFGHHSAAQFDFAQTVRIDGVVKEITVANPHIELVLTVEDEKGKRDIEYEGHSRNNVFRRGWRPDMVKVGDEIAIEIAPMRTGEDGGYVKNFILKDGTQF